MASLFKDLENTERTEKTKGPHLIRVQDGNLSKLLVFHLGQAAIFERNDA